MANQLTDENIEEICNFYQNTVYSYYPVSNDFFKDLYNTGCRPGELLQSNRWTYVSPWEINLQPEKGNNIRQFNEIELSDSLIFAIQNQIKPYQNLTWRQLSSVLKKISYQYTIETQKKSAVTYIFRYNYIKKLHDAGKTDQELREIMGWNNEFMPSIYYNQNLFYTGRLPPPLENFITDQDGNILIDQDGTTITQ